MFRQVCRQSFGIAAGRFGFFGVHSASNIISFGLTIGANAIITLSAKFGDLVPLGALLICILPRLERLYVGWLSSVISLFCCAIPFRMTIISSTLKGLPSVTASRV